MINANELRIGNMLIVGGIERLVFVSAIFKTHFRCQDMDGISFEESIRCNYIPIPLSEEILLKVGFEIKPFSTGLTLDRFRFIWKPEYKYWYVIDAYSHSYLTKIEFVHELQNFVFVMNGQELNTSGLINTNKT